VAQDMDVCMGCGMMLPSRDPRPADVPRPACPRCGAVGRQKSAGCTMTAAASLTANAQLIIGWHEVDRLVGKAEYAAALLVAAVNIEFILWEQLRRFKPAAGLAAASEKVKSTWGQIRAGHGEMVSLSSLISVAECFTQHDNFSLSPPWDPLPRDIDTVRNCIAHERGYFASLTELKEPDWPEARIRQVLEDAKAFCHGNAP